MNLCGINISQTTQDFAEIQKEKMLFRYVIRKQITIGTSYAFVSFSVKNLLENEWTVFVLFWLKAELLKMKFIRYKDKISDFFLSVFSFKYNVFFKMLPISFVKFCFKYVFYLGFEYLHLFQVKLIYNENNSGNPGTICINAISCKINAGFRR